MPVSEVIVSKRVQSSTVSRRTRNDVPNNFNVKSALGKLTKTIGEWKDADSTANGVLYELLGEIYETDSRIGDDEGAIKTLRDECRSAKQIVNGVKNFKIATAKVRVLLIAYAIGNRDNAPRRSQWKKTFERADEAGISSNREAFSVWLNRSGGIEGAISNGKNRAQNKAKTKQPNQQVSDHKELLENLKKQYILETTRALEVDLTNAKNYRETTFSNNCALVMVLRETNPDTAEVTYSILSFVNDSGLLQKAAEVIGEENSKSAELTQH